MTMGSDNIGKDGLPEMSLDERNNGEATTMKLLMGLFTIPVVIGYCIAYAIYTFGSTAAYAQKIALVVSYDMHYVYLAAFIISRLTVWLNNYPMLAKSRVMTAKSGNLRSNMYIFKEYNSDKTVVLDDGEETGKYNRANRSLHHYVENVPGLLVGMPLAGFCFPMAAVVLVSIFAVGRILHQSAYTKGYGAHAPGFMLAMLSAATMDGVILLVALKGFF